MSNNANTEKKFLPYEAYFKYQSLNRLMRYLAMSLGLLESYQRIGEGFRFDAFEPFRDALLQTYLLSQNLLERAQERDANAAQAQTPAPAAGASNNDEDNKDLLHPEERRHLLTCVQYLAGCVEFSGVGSETRYLQLCNAALTELRKVQQFFTAARFWYPNSVVVEENEENTNENNIKNMQVDESERMKKRLESLYKKLCKDEADMLKSQEPFLSQKQKDDEKLRIGTLKSEREDQITNGTQLSAKDGIVETVPKDQNEWKEAQKALKAYLRTRKEDHEKIMQENKKTARSRDPVLYRSRGPNSYSASKRPKSARSKQLEEDKKPWKMWRMEKSQFLLSTSRSIGVLRASIKSEGFRYDAFQPFLGALRDTFELCEKYLKRNETDEEYLTVSERNTLLAAIVGLTGCVTFTGVSAEDKYGEICKELALVKLDGVVHKLSSTGQESTQAYQQQMYWTQQQQQTSQQQQQQQFYPQYMQQGGGNNLDYWNPGGQSGNGYYGQVPNWPRNPPTPWGWPGPYSYFPGSPAAPTLGQPPQGQP